jgi:hypothetical protein
MTVGRLLEEISARELAEWQVFLERDAQISTLVSKGTDFQLAHEMAWGKPPAEDGETEGD